MGKLLQYLSEKYAIENIEEVNRRLLELSSLFEISQTLNRSLNLKHILDNVLLIPMGRMMISRGIILLKEAGQLIVANKKGRLDIAHDRISIQPRDEEQIHQHPEIQKIAHNANLPLTIPLRSAQELAGILMLGKKLNEEPFTDEEINFLESLASIAATSIQNAQRLHQLETMNLVLQEKVRQLDTVLTLSRDFLSTLNENEILQRLVEVITAHLNIPYYAIYDVTDNILQRREAKCVDELPQAIPAHELAISHTVGLISNEHSVFESLLKAGLRLFIPLTFKEQLITVIFVGIPEGKSTYQESDLYFFQTLANQASIALHNARLFEESLEKERLEREIDLAREIQLNLLPSRLPHVPGYQLAGVNWPSRTVGGDYYDVIPLSDDRLALVIGDVTGKGIPAAMLMANLQAALHLLILERIPLSVVLEKLNALFYANTPSDKFVTLFIGILHSPTRQFTYVNAGHNYPLLIDADGTIRELTTGGLLVGAFPHASYQVETVTLNPGSLLVCYTDGVTELTNNQGEEFGEERLYRFLQNHRHLPLASIIDHLRRTLVQFSEMEIFEDDVTLLGLKVE